jgi:phosphomannomutase/phosphoglucomutase
VSIFKACDIRGRFGKELTTAHAKKLGSALRTLQGPVQVLVGGDGRLSTPELKSALIESLLRSGCDVVDLGQIPTPLFYFARRRLGLETGVMVTASHNPASDNGFKVTLGPMPITTDEMQLIAWQMDLDTPPSFTDPRGNYQALDLLDEYVQFLAGLAPDLSGQRVVVDCANGMAGLVARRAWAHTGARVDLILETIDGHFPVHAPNPAEVKNLDLLRREVLAREAGLGVAYDGDADRVGFVDETATPVSGDRAIVLFARAALQHQSDETAGEDAGCEDAGNAIVYDQKCSRIVPDAIRTSGGTPIMERSGHTYIKRAFLEHAAVYAGELSGHHFLRSAGGDDALAASLQFAGMLKRAGRPLSHLTAEIPSYPITPDLRIPMSSDDIAGLIAELEEVLEGEAGLTHRDGLRLDFSDGWGLVRPSVTEPVVTMRFEGITPQALERILRRVEEAAPKLHGKLIP